MNGAEKALIAVAVAGATAGALALARARGRSLVGVERLSNVVPIIAPVITMEVAENILSALERLPLTDLTVVIHTRGGSVGPCVMLSQAIAQFATSRAIVPYLALSGGTLLALSTTHLAMGRSASLSAVDPLLNGIRSRPLAAQVETSEDRVVGSMARDYEGAVRKLLADRLSRRLARLEYLPAAMAAFMGEQAPHEWPIPIEAVAGLGLPVTRSDPHWADAVDEFRRRWW